MSPKTTIPEQTAVPWATVLAISWAALKRRLLRSLITMTGVVLAIAFVSYMLTLDSVTRALVLVNDVELNVILQDAGIDIMAGGKTDTLMLLLLGLSLLTCAVGILNAMLMSVTERVKEIGTLKCIGARDLFIVKAYFIESSLQGICGALLGMTLGCVVGILGALKAYGMYAIHHFPVLSVFCALLISFVCGSLISILAAIAPAYVAARKEPVEALRVAE